MPGDVVDACLFARGAHHDVRDEVTKSLLIWRSHSGGPPIRSFVMTSPSGWSARVVTRSSFPAFACIAEFSENHRRPNSLLSWFRFFACTIIRATWKSSRRGMSTRFCASSDSIRPTPCSAVAKPAGFAVLSRKQAGKSRALRTCAALRRGMRSVSGNYIGGKRRIRSLARRRPHA